MEVEPYAEEAERLPPPPSVGGLLDDVGGEGVVAGDADGVASERVGAGPGPAVTAAGQAEEAEGGEEHLAVGGRHQVVEDGVDGRADVEQHVGHHVEVVVEVVEAPGRSEDNSQRQCSVFGIFPQFLSDVHLMTSYTVRVIFRGDH